MLIDTTKICNKPQSSQDSSTASADANEGHTEDWREGNFMTLSHMKRVINAKIDDAFIMLSAHSSSSKESSRRITFDLYLSMVKKIIYSCEEESSHNLRYEIFRTMFPMSQQQALLVNSALDDVC